MNQSKPHKQPYTKGAYTPMAKLHRVAARRATGETIKQICEHEQLSKVTVLRILAQDERKEILQAFRDECLNRLVRKAMDALEYNLDKNDRQAAVDTLRGTRVFTERLEVEGAYREPERDYASSTVLFFQKYNRWPTLEEVKKFDKTIDVPLLTKGSE